jgi:hypothetical protein
LEKTRWPLFGLFYLPFPAEGLALASLAIQESLFGDTIENRPHFAHHANRLDMDDSKETMYGTRRVAGVLRSFSPRAGGLQGTGPAVPERTDADPRL